MGQQRFEVQLFGNDSGENALSQINRVLNAWSAAALRTICGYTCLYKI